MKTLNEIQDEINVWATQNFGHRAGWQPLLGLIEEVGELSHHYLKRSQGIRLNEDHVLGIEDAVGDIAIYLMDFCNAEGISLEAVLQRTWEHVSERDWKKHVNDGTK
jgi:NTP pyrophosphatase (non-canonical NTP hydrolase)